MRKQRRLKVAWTSNAQWATSGYGSQTQDMEKMFIKAGWNTDNFSLINMWGQQGAPFLDEHKILNFPIMNHTGGSDAMLHHGNNWGADIVIGLFDIWVQNPQDLSGIKRFIPWVPVDYDPPSKGILGNLRFANRIIAMSKFGQQKLREAGFMSTYIPHHVDTKIFHPIDKITVKEGFKINPQTVVFGMVAENKSLISRKSYQQVLDAYKLFLQKSKQPSLLYIHTNPDFPGGFPIKQYAEFLGINQNLAFPDMYQMSFKSPRSVMNNIFNMFDILLNPSSSEGFGIPIIEAQATGIPVIVNDWTSMPELITKGQTGLITKRGHQMFMPAGGYVTFPDVQSLSEQMLRMTKWDSEVTKKACLEWVKQYDIDYVWENHWEPFLTRIDKEIYGAELPRTYRMVDTIKTPSLTAPNA